MSEDSSGHWNPQTGKYQENGGGREESWVDAGIPLSRIFIQLVLDRVWVLILFKGYLDNVDLD